MNIVRHQPDYLLNGKHERISIGVEPSGWMHLGNRATIYQGMLALQKNPHATLDLRVCDLDYHYKAGIDFPSYFIKPLQASIESTIREVFVENTMREALLCDLACLVNEIGHFLGVDTSRVKVDYMSPITHDPRFQAMLKHLFLTEEGLDLLRRSILNPPTADPYMLLAPNCPDCKHSTNKKMKLIDKQEGIFSAVCKNEKCGVDEYKVGLTEPERMNLFYLLTPIRDLLADSNGQSCSIHIFGGDYIREPHGQLGLTRAERISALFVGLSATSPTIYIGPLSLDKEGKKRSKSASFGKTKVSIIDKSHISMDERSAWVEKLKNWYERIEPWSKPYLVGE